MPRLVPYTPEDRIKLRAQAYINKLVRLNIIPPAKTQDCALCGNPARVWHHHNGYLPPHDAEVIALCNPCHYTVHGNNLAEI